MQIIDNNGKIHNVRKYVLSGEGEESIWCDDWYGRHVIGKDCKFYDNNIHILSGALEYFVNGWGDFLEKTNIANSFYSAKQIHFMNEVEIKAKKALKAIS